MKVLIEINCDNDAFGDEPHFEIIRLLEDTADRIEIKHKLDNMSIFDINGDKVGELKIEE